MIELREYRPEDYLSIVRRKFDMMTFLNFPDKKAVANNLVNGPSFTGISEEGIIACGGVLVLWKGVGEAWVITSPLVNLYPLTFAKIVKRKLKQIIIDNNLERVQTVVDKEHIISREWVKWMGFTYEGPMRKYIGGRNFIRYAWIKEN